jgi:hypothetical protein
MLNSILRCGWLAIAGLRCAVQRSCSVLAGIEIGLCLWLMRTIRKNILAGWILRWPFVVWPALR